MKSSHYHVRNDQNDSCHCFAITRARTFEVDSCLVHVGDSGAPSRRPHGLRPDAAQRQSSLLENNIFVLCYSISKFMIFQNNDIEQIGEPSRMAGSDSGIDATVVTLYSRARSPVSWADVRCKSISQSARQLGGGCIAMASRTAVKQVSGQMNFIQDWKIVNCRTQHANSSNIVDRHEWRGIWFSINHLKGVKAGHSSQQQALSHTAWAPDEQDVPFFEGERDVREDYFALIDLTLEVLCMQLISGV